MWESVPMRSIPGSGCRYAPPLLLPAVRVCLLFLVGGCLPISSFAESWTNAAGHAVNATLVDGNRRTVVLRVASGRERRMAIKSLCPADQVRARARLGLPDPPTAAARSRAQSAALPTRAGKLYEAGTFTPSELRRVRHALEAGSRIVR